MTDTKHDAIHVVVTKYPDGHAYMTKDGHGEILNDDVTVGKTVKCGEECTLEVVVDPGSPADAPAYLARFSYVDYLDTSTAGVPHPDGVRHTWEFEVPGHRDFGPYAVSAGVDVPARG